MNESDIRKYAGLMQELGLTGLEITEDNRVVRLERNPAQTVKEVVNIAAPVAARAESAASAGTAAADYDSVKSSLVGVFYAAPGENAEPYVSVGDTVKKGQTLCIIEAMKLMNEIVSEYDGVISEICAAN